MQSLSKIHSYLIGCSVIVCLATSCNNNYKAVSVNSVHEMMDSVARIISLKGPKEWLDYFDDTSSFFMASDGKLVFPNYTVATKFINDTLVNIFSVINLKWKNINVDVLSNNNAVVRAGFHEDIKFKQGNIATYDGFFTAVIDNTSKGCKFRNLHWSITK